MLFKNRHFAPSILLVFYYQAVLALSTYFIAKASKQLGNRSSESDLNYIAYFFSCFNSLLLKLIFKNFYYHGKKYSSYCFSCLNQDQSLSTDKNKRTYINWAPVEAINTIGDTSDFILDCLSIHLNIIMTMLVFMPMLGYFDYRLVYYT